MKPIKALMIVLGLFALSGCSVFDSYSEVNALNEAQAVGSPFTQTLAQEYRNFSNSELRDMFDYPDALHFARKGLAAAAGENVLPEPVTDWNLETSQNAELNAARGRLLIAFDLGAREVAPQLAATAQARFDCWIEQAEENDSDGKGCKAQFMDAMNQLEGQLQPPPQPAQPMENAGGVFEPVEPLDMQPSEPMVPEDAVYLVFFNWDSSELGSAALNVLDAVAQEVRNNPPSQVDVTGHADTSGSTQYNDRLAFRRATVVRDALVERGVPADILKIEGRGENELLVPTPDDVREPANRRANISFR